VSPIEQVSQLINCLTKDEDQRQDLWVHYLSGHSPSTLASHLSKLKKEFSNDADLQHLLWDVFNNPPSDKFKELLANFSEIEQSIVCLLALGLSISELSQYKSISEVRIRHIIQVIRYNEVWKEIYGVEETIDRR